MGRSQQYPIYHKDKPWPSAQDRRPFLPKQSLSTSLKARRSQSLLLAVLLLLAGTLFFLWPAHHHITPTERLREFTKDKDTGNQAGAPWEYDYAKHARFHGLSDSQCDIAFPHLFDKLHEEVARREDTTLVTADEIDIKGAGCLLRVLIYDAELHVLGENKECNVDNWHERASGILHAINRAITAALPLAIPNAEFVINIATDPQQPIDDMGSEDDAPNLTTVFALTKRAGQDNTWLMPDFAYWAAPSAQVASHAAARRAMDDENEEWPWEKKTPQLIWRGTHFENRDFLDPLLMYVEGRKWDNVKVCDEPKSQEDDDSARYCLSQQEHCRYKFPLHTESRLNNGKLKFLQLCNSALVLRPLRWIEHHTHLLVANGTEQNYIPVNKDFSDLNSKIEYYLANDKEAARIAQNSYEAFFERYLTPAATSCYWRRAITAWASVQGYEPQLYDWDDQIKTMKRRGTHFESYAITSVEVVKYIDKPEAKKEEEQFEEDVEHR